VAPGSEAPALTLSERSEAIDSPEPTAATASSLA
jgi:hypothetical protein